MALARTPKSVTSLWWVRKNAIARHGTLALTPGNNHEIWRFILMFTMFTIFLEVNKYVVTTSEIDGWFPMLWKKRTPHFRPYVIYIYYMPDNIMMNQQVLGYTWVHYFQTNPDQDPWLQIRYWERITCLHMDAFDISIQAFISLEVIIVR